MMVGSDEPAPAQHDSVAPIPPVAAVSTSGAHYSGGDEDSATGVASATCTSESAEPSPLTVGTRFVKQYYKTISTSPEKIFRFYQPSSVMSVGMGSSLTSTSTFEILSSNTKDRFKPFEDENGKQNSEFINTQEKKFESCRIRFEFEHGAIDAQQSIDKSILLVVTGHIVYLNSECDQIAEEVIDRKGFVHTFFLCRTLVGSRVNYYVHNDILRFLCQPLHDTPNESPTTTTMEIPRTDPTSSLRETDPVVSTLVEPQATLTDSVLSEDLKVFAVIDGDSIANDAPGGGIEESKEFMLEEADDGREVGEEHWVDLDDKNRQFLGSPMQEEQVESEVVDLKDTALASIASAPNKEKDSNITGSDYEAISKLSGASTLKSNISGSPGSWASLVAGSVTDGISAESITRSKIKPTQNTSTNSSKSTTREITTQSEFDEADSVRTKVESVNVKNTYKDTTNNVENVAAMKQNNNHSQNLRGPKLVGNDANRRDPDSTLVIRNIPFNVLEKDIMLLFEKFATDVNGRVIRCTVNADRGIAFMDYDSPDPVLNAISVHKQTPFFLLDRKLHIYQKIVDHGSSNNSNYQNDAGHRSNPNRGHGGRGNVNNKHIANGRGREEASIGLSSTANANKGSARFSGGGQQKGGDVGGNFRQHGNGQEGRGGERVGGLDRKGPGRSGR